MKMFIPRQVRSLFPICLLALLPLALVSHPGFGGQRPASAADDDSDWRTAVAKRSAETYDPQHLAQHRELPAANFDILGVPVAPGEIKEAALKIGKATSLSLGDANFTSTQACYLSAAAPNDVHLVFAEDGEGVGDSIILFGADHPWNGNQACAKSPRLSKSTATANGLHLGLTLAQVQSILGKPSKATAERVEYIFQVRKKTTPATLKILRSRESYMSDPEFHASYDFYYSDQHIVARFTDRKLTYLAVTLSQTYP